MTAKRIDKRSDPAVRLLRHVRDGADRSRVFVEGGKSIREMIASGWVPAAIYCRPDTLSEATGLRVPHPSIPLVTLSADVMRFVSDLSTPPGLIAIAKRRRSPEPNPGAARLDLVLQGVQLPQNVGSLIRLAEAAGVAQVWVTQGTADPWGPKAVRGSAGSVFRVPVRAGLSLAETAKQLAAAGVALVGASARGSVDYDAFDWRAPAALAVGAEGSGFAPEDERNFSALIRIPMRGRAESLNVAAAAAVCLFEADRQRRAGGLR